MIFRWILHLLLAFRIPFLLMLIAGIVYLIAYRMRLWGLGPKNTVLPATAKYGSRSSRIAEALILACVLSTLVIFWTIVRFQWFKSNTPNEILMTHKLFITGLAVLVLIAVLTTLWRTWRGCLVALAVGVIAFFSGITEIEFRQTVNTAYGNGVSYTITVNQHPGADVWVNDVYLGKSPVDISLKEFADKIPYWPEPPKEINNKIEKKNFDYRSYGSWGTQSQSEWIELTTHQKHTYYVRVQMDGVIGYGSRRGTSGHNNNREYHLGVNSPLHDQRIEKLLDIARMSNYEVDEAWLKAMDSYGSDGWQALHKDAYHDWIGSGKLYYRWLTPKISEPGMLKVMDAWVSWRYGLDKVTNEKEAWDVFRQLCSSTDSDNDYSTNSLQGHALGLLLGKLNHEQFVECAIQLIQTEKFRQIGFYSHQDWMRGRIEYPKDKNHRKGFPSDYLIVDAIWRLDGYLDTIDESSPNIVERQISKAILFWQGPVNYPAYRLAVDIGGSDIAPYLTKCWQASKRGDRRFRHGFSTSSIPKNVNLWFLLLANLSGDEGKEFRSEYVDDFQQLIEIFAEDRDGKAFVWGSLDFISKDVDKGDQCAGAKYWPDYFELVKNSKEEYQNDKLKRLWSYLIRVEPVMPVETYVQCWREVEDRYGKFRRTIWLLDVLPAEKRRLVLEGLKRELQLRPGNVKNIENKPASEHDIKIIQEDIARMIADANEASFAQNIIKGLQEYNRYSKRIQEWLLQVRPGHIAGEVMANSNDVKLRQISVDLLANHPTPHRMELLAKLANDPDDQVSAAAQEAIDELNHFRSNPAILQAKTGTTAVSGMSKPSEIVIRLYTDQLSDSEYSIIEHPIGFVHSAQKLKAEGPLAYKVVNIERGSLEEVTLPDKGFAVICSIDQHSPAVQDVLGNNIYAWKLPYRTPAIRKYRGSKQRLLCDAAERPIPNTLLTVELKEHQTQKTIRISGFRSDVNGMLQMPDGVMGSFHVSAFLFDHPDYGIARIDSEALHQEKNIVVPLLKVGAKEYDRALFGTVIDPEGNPIEAANVEVAGIYRDFHVVPIYMNRKSVLTDKNGRFNIYPSGRNIRSKIAPKAKYRLRITVPEQMNLPPYLKLHSNGEELTIKIEPEGGFHTISFETTDGDMMDDNQLKESRIIFAQPNGGRLEFLWDYWKDGAVLPEGQYRANIRGIRFIPVRISKDSPVNIVFRQEPDKQFSCRVVRGITGEPLANVFVIESMGVGERLFSDLTSENWDSLHSLGAITEADNDITKLIRRISPFDVIMRTDENGRLTIKKKPRSFYNFIVFDENFMPFSHRVNSKEIQGQTEIDLGDIKLFPAARVKLGLDHEKSVEVIPFPIIDKDAPAWADAYQEFVGFSYDRWHRIKEPRWIHVPAGAKFQLRLGPSWGKWSPLLIEKPIYLEQGQELDLGLVKLEPTVKMTVKVVDTEGKPLESISITLAYNNEKSRRHIGHTNADGKIDVFLNTNLKGKITAQKSGWNQVQVPFEISKTAPDGKVIEIVCNKKKTDK